jgi:hypothetical protein
VATLDRNFEFQTLNFKEEEDDACSVYEAEGMDGSVRIGGGGL